MVTLPTPGETNWGPKLNQALTELVDTADLETALAAERAAQSGTYVSKVGAVIDARDNPYANITANGIADDAAAWSALILGVSAAGGGLIQWRGRSRYTSSLPMRSNVGLVGHGWGRSVLAPTGSAHGFEQGGSMANPLTNLLFEDFEIDCQDQVGLWKGMFAIHMRRLLVRGVWCHDSGASGLGVDYLRDAVFEECLVEGSGRNGTTASPGCSGFGIGTGLNEIENVTLLACTARGNKRYGAFFERLSGATTYSRGPQIIGGRYEGNHRGIGDNGSRDMLINGAHLHANTEHGLYVGADQAQTAGYDGQLVNAKITDNGGNGAFFDYATGPQHGRYSVLGSTIEGNAGCGVRATASGSVPDIVIHDNPSISRNGRSGVLLSGGTFIDPSIRRNKLNANGQTDTGGITNGIHTIANLTRPIIKENHAHDNGVVQKQAFGVALGAGNVSGGHVSDNNLANNLTGAFSNAATIAAGATATRIERNAGYNPRGWDTLTVSASPWSYTAGPAQEVINLISGTVSNVAVTDRNGTTTNVAVSAPTTINLDPYDVMVVTYSVAPNAKRLRR